MSKKLVDIKSAIENLKTKLLGSERVKEIEKIDTVLAKISNNIIDKDSLNYAEMIRGTFSDVLKSDSFSNLPNNVLGSADDRDRFLRYANAEEICDNITYCSRALSVLSDEIVAPDDITKQVVHFLEESALSEEDEKNLQLLRSINKTLNIEDYIPNIVHDTLKFGDQFIEICDYMSEDVPITQSLLNEEVNISPSMEHTVVSESAQGTESYNVSVSIVEASTKEKSTEGKRNEDVLRRTRLIVHDSRYVLKIQSDRFKMCLGYLIIPKVNNGKGQSSMPGSSHIGQSSSLMSNSIQGLTGVDKIFAEVISKVKKHIGNNSNDEEIVINKKESLKMISRVINEYEENNIKLKLRYVPPERMEHFKIGGGRFFPYGEGIFHKVTFPAKLLIALQTAITIKRVSDASDKRVMYTETGIPRDVRNLIEDVKESMKKRRFSLDAAGSVGSVSSMVTNYEDYFIPQRNGKRFLEFDTIPRTIDVRDIANELKFMRDNLISALEVPPSYIGMEENLANKNALTHESILFARTIVSYQNVLSKCLKSLFSKLFKFTYNKNIPRGVNVNFSSPRMLQNERDAENAETVNRIVMALSELGIPREYLKRKYLSFDWDEIKRFETEENMRKQMEGDSGGEEEGQFGSQGGY